MGVADSRQAGADIHDWRHVLVTPEMAEAGADQLRLATLGADWREIATDMFYAMQGAYDPVRNAALVSRFP